MVTQLILPIVLASVALFFASFLSWMVLQLHKPDWRKLPDEDKFLAGARQCSLPVGSYMFPACEKMSDMQSAEFQRKMAAGPRGVMTILPNTNMGVNLGLTFVYFLVVNFCLAYLATIAFEGRSVDFMAVFRFVSTAALVAFLTAIVGHSIWFRARIVGHIIESIAYAAIVGAIYAAMWPAAAS